MNNKEKFISKIEELVNTNVITLTEEEQEYFEFLKKNEEKTLFTKDGANILLYMRKNPTSISTAKDIGIGINKSSRSVSGSLRKLVTDKYVEKVGQNPTSYRLTKLGEEIEIELKENNE